MSGSHSASAQSPETNVGNSIRSAPTEADSIPGLIPLVTVFLSSERAGRLWAKAGSRSNNRSQSNREGDSTDVWEKGLSMRNCDSGDGRDTERLGAPSRDAGRYTTGKRLEPLWMLLLPTGEAAGF